MKLLPRRASEPDPEPQDEAADDLGEQPGGVTLAKGRPTPKRRDVTGVRGPVTAPKTRKEAAARQREQAKVARETKRTPAAQMTPAQRRAALKAGDPTVLPRRDQGQTRKLARDYVDSHRMLSNYLFVVIVILILSLAIKILELLVLFFFLVLLVEWWFTGRKIRSMAIERFGKAEGGPMTIGFYAGSRAYLPRKWRLPAPQVQRGDEI